MIPRHRPPFGIAELTRAMLPASGPRCVEQLEQAYADTLQVPHAVWLPSARYGICHTLDIGLRPQDQVYCPAFTCRVVHQAIRQSARIVNFVDSNAHDPLMDLRILEHSGKGARKSHQDSIKSSVGNIPGYGIVLSEVFGYRYVASDCPFLRDASLRIFDMAMCIPTVDDMQRLVHRDVALISFGLGKSLYAGWGGMAFTRNRQMAECLRKKRDQDLRTDPNALQWRQIASVWLRTIAHSTWLYKFCRRTAESRASTSATRNGQQPETVNLQTGEWSRGPAAFHLRLAGENLRRSADYSQDRIEYSKIYRAELLPLTGDDTDVKRGWLTLLPASPDALSHFCIRVAPELRDSLRQHLWNNGFDTAMLFPFPKDADSGVLHNTWLLTQEVIGLPLSNDLGRHRIHQLCSMIKQFATLNLATSYEPAGQQPEHNLSAAA